MIIGACLWLPRTLWDKLGGFPEWFGFLAEDMYICCLARLWGYSVKALPDSGFDHWVGRSLGGGKVTRNNKLSTTTTRRALSERNKTFVMFISYPPLFLFLLFPLHIVLLCLEGMLLSVIKGNLRLWKDIYWNCLQEIMRQRKSLFAVRAYVQCSRKISSLSFATCLSWIPHKLSMLIRHGLPEVK